MPLNPRAYERASSKKLDTIVVETRQEQNNVSKVKRKSTVTRTKRCLADIFFLMWCLQNLVPKTESFLSQYDKIQMSTSLRCAKSIAKNLNTVEVPLTNTTCLYPWPPEAFADLHSFYLHHPNFHPDQDVWQKLCPRPIHRNEFVLRPVLFNTRQNQPNPTRSLDISRFWSLEDDPQLVASEVMRDCLHFEGRHQHSSNDTMERYLSTSLAESLQAYREFCCTHLLSFLLNHRRIRFKCRLVATLGPSGAKCPQYHVDHVPVRWIQTFVGPGVELVMGNKGVRWDVLLERDHELSHNNNYAVDKPDNSTTIEEVVSWTPRERNLQLVDSTVANVFCAKEGESVLMLGNQWNELRDVLESQEGIKTAKVEPVVHKSPEISTFQPRVLLTQDVILV
jgi:Protein of unknown function (DUF1826)